MGWQKATSAGGWAAVRREVRTATRGREELDLE